MSDPLLRHRGRWLMTSRFVDGDTVRHSLVDIGPSPARGSLAELHVNPQTSDERFVAEAPGVSIPLIGYFLSSLGLADEFRRPLDLEPPEDVDGALPYREIAAILCEPGLPSDPHLAAAVGMARVLLELAAEGRDIRSGDLLRDVVRNLVDGVEDPTTLIPL